MLLRAVAVERQRYFGRLREVVVADRVLVEVCRILIGRNRSTNHTQMIQRVN